MGNGAASAVLSWAIFQLVGTNVAAAPRGLLAATAYFAIAALLTYSVSSAGAAKKEGSGKSA
jgi:high-affinity Fe2+/Pb2+ permease